MGRLDDMQVKMDQQQEELLAAANNAATAVQEELRRGNRDVIVAVGHVHGSILSCSSSTAKQLTNLRAAVDEGRELEKEEKEDMQRELRAALRELQEKMGSNTTMESVGASLQQLEQAVQAMRCRSLTTPHTTLYHNSPCITSHTPHAAWTTPWCCSTTSSCCTSNCKQ